MNWDGELPRVRRGMARGEVDEGMLAVGGLMNPALGNPGRPCWVVLALFFSLSFSLSFSFFF